MVSQRLDHQVPAVRQPLGERPPRSLISRPAPRPELDVLAARPRLRGGLVEPRRRGRRAEKRSGSIPLMSGLSPRSDGSAGGSAEAVSPSSAATDDQALQNLLNESSAIHGATRNSAGRFGSATPATPATPAAGATTTEAEIEGTTTRMRADRKPDRWKCAQRTVPPAWLVRVGEKLMSSWALGNCGSVWWGRL